MRQQLHLQAAALENNHYITVIRYQRAYARRLHRHFHTVTVVMESVYHMRRRTDYNLGREIFVLFEWSAVSNCPYTSVAICLADGDGRDVEELEELLLAALFFPFE